MGKMTLVSTRIASGNNHLGSQDKSHTLANSQPPLGRLTALQSLLHGRGSNLFLLKQTLILGMDLFGQN